jgi:hypothetical protein
MVSRLSVYTCMDVRMDLRMDVRMDLRLASIWTVARILFLVGNQEFTHHRLCSVNVKILA